MKIGELARRTAVSERSLRYYEQQELLVPERTGAGHRVYEEWAVDRVVRIQELYAAGLSSSRIEAMLPCMRHIDGGPSATATPALADELRKHRACLDRQITDLQRTREVLDDVIETAQRR